jgi:hypothetical protein
MACFNFSISDWFPKIFSYGNGKGG